MPNMERRNTKNINRRMARDLMTDVAFGTWMMVYAAAEGGFGSTTTNIPFPSGVAICETKPVVSTGIFCAC
jgi:hypothetical protein